MGQSRGEKVDVGTGTLAGAGGRPSRDTAVVHGIDNHLLQPELSMPSPSTALPLHNPSLH